MASSSMKHGIRCTLNLRLPKDVVCHSGQLAGILGSETVDVASKKEPPHFLLANLRDDEAVLGFVKRWGQVTSGNGELPKTLRHSQDLFVGPMAEATQALRAAHSESEGDWDAPVLFFESQPRIIQLRDTLQKAWKGDAQTLQLLQNTVKGQIGSTWAFKKGRIEITAYDSWAAACLLFLQDHAAGNLAICKNPDCPARFFIKKRKNQKICEAGDCVAFAVRQRTLEWWKKHGNEWRKQRRKKAQGRKH